MPEFNKFHQTEINSYFGADANLTTADPDSVSSRPGDLALASVCYIFAICGMAANLLVVLVVGTQKTMWKPSPIYVLCLAILDGTMSAFIMPFQGTAVLTGESINGCDVVGSIQLFLRMTIVCVLSAIAVNRFLAVFLSFSLYRRAYALRNVGISIAAMTILGILPLLPIWLGQYEPGYRTSVGFCVATIQSDTHRTGYSISVIYTCLYGVPSICVITVSYVGVWRRFKRSTRMVNATQLPSTSTASDTKTFKLTRTLFILTSVYALCWVPGYIVNILDYFYHVPTPLLKAVDVLCFASSVLNPILYSMMNHQFTSVMKQNWARFCCFTCTKHSISPHTRVHPEAAGEGNTVM